MSKSIIGPLGNRYLKFMKELHNRAGVVILDLNVRKPCAKEWIKEDSLIGKKAHTQFL